MSTEEQATRVNYEEYLQSEKWQAKRREVFATSKHRCRACFSRRYVLHVHHMTYAHLGDEPLSDLVILCSVCHGAVHMLHEYRPGDPLELVTRELIRETKYARQRHQDRHPPHSAQMRAIARGTYQGKWRPSTRWQKDEIERIRREEFGLAPGERSPAEIRERYFRQQAAKRKGPRRKSPRSGRSGYSGRNK